MRHYKRWCIWCIVKRVSLCLNVQAWPWVFGVFGGSTVQIWGHMLCWSVFATTWFYVTDVIIHLCHSFSVSIIYISWSNSLQTSFNAGLTHPTTALKSVPHHNADTTSIKFNKVSNNVKTNNKKSAFKSLAKSALSFIVIATTITSISAPAHAAAAAAAVEATEHLHIGQKIANYFQSFGIPDLAVLAMISAMPVIELRGAVPVGVWMGLPISQVLPVCVLGNMVPIVPLLFLLKNDKLKWVYYFLFDVYLLENFDGWITVHSSHNQTTLTSPCNCMKSNKQTINWLL